MKKCILNNMPLQNVTSILRSTEDEKRIFYNITTFRILCQSIHRHCKYCNLDEFIKTYKMNGKKYKIMTKNTIDCTYYAYKIGHLFGVNLISQFHQSYHP